MNTLASFSWLDDIPLLILSPAIVDFAASLSAWAPNWRFPAGLPRSEHHQRHDHVQHPRGEFDQDSSRWSGSFGGNWNPHSCIQLLKRFSYNNLCWALQTQKKLFGKGVSQLILELRSRFVRCLTSRTRALKLSLSNAPQTRAPGSYCATHQALMSSDSSWASFSLFTFII